MFRGMQSSNQYLMFPHPSKRNPGSVAILSEPLSRQASLLAQFYLSKYFGNTDASGNNYKSFLIATILRYTIRLLLPRLLIPDLPFNRSALKGLKCTHFSQGASIEFRILFTTLFSPELGVSCAPARIINTINTCTTGDCLNQSTKPMFNKIFQAGDTGETISDCEMNAPMNKVGQKHLSLIPSPQCIGVLTVLLFRVFR